MKIQQLPSKNGCACFRLSEVDKSFANALRRTLLGNIPIQVFTPEDCIITTNTSRFTNEIIKGRLACVPIHYKKITDKLTVTLSKKNTSHGIEYVTSNDFEYTTKEKLFPETHIKIDGKTYKEPIEILRLRPGEELSLTCTTGIKTANDGGTYNSVGTCAYGFTQDEEASDAEWQRTQRDISKKEWDLLGAKRFVKKNSFDFILKSVGVYSESELLHKALHILKAQFDYCKSITLESIEPSLTTISDCFEVKLTGNYTFEGIQVQLSGDYTIGNMLEYQIYTKFENPITFVTFFKKHPHDPTGTLRIAFPNATKELVISQIVTACDECIDLVNELIGKLDA
jgi:DNA-directed RNA polymerase subunit L